MTDTSLWDFALATYARPGVERICLRLQDEQGLKVNFLLWALWLDRSGVAVDEQFWRGAEQQTRRLQRRIVCWRLSRRALPKIPGLGRLRNWIKVRELLAEKHQLERLAQLTANHKARSLKDRHVLAVAGATSYLELCFNGVKEAPVWREKLESMVN